MAGLHFDITGDNSNFLRKLDEARNGVRTTSKQIEESGVSIEQMFGRLVKGAAAFGAGFTAKELISNVVRVRGEFQQLEVAFNTMLGSEDKATALMSQLVKTAATTPFDLQSVANGAKQLLAYGTSAEDVNGTLVQLGDIAAGLSIPLNDLVWLYGTTMTQGRLFTQDFRQFQSRGIPLADELAKQFGVTKDKVGELVTAGKVGFPEVQKAIVAMTSEGGKFGGLMAAQSRTITGQISNIEDSFSTMYNNIGKQSEGFINDALSGVSYLVANYEEIGRSIIGLAATYGAYKAVLMSVAAYQSMAVGITYAAEIAELSKLIPLKQQSANQDVIAAVNSGKLTQAKAEQVIALRAEIAAKIQSLQATEAQTKVEYASAMASYKVATQRMLLAKQNMAIAQSQMSIAIKSGTVEEIATAKKNAQTASLELNNAAVAKNTAHKGVNIAATNSKSASEALNTVQTGLNTVSQNTNTISTNILTVAKTRLAAASRALGLSMLANPYVLAAAAVVGLGYAIYKVVTAETELDKAHKRLNDATSGVEKGLASEVSKLTSLERKLAETKKGTEEYNIIKKTIVDSYGQYYKGLDGEIERVGNLSTVYGQLVEAMRLSIGQRKFESFFKAEQDNLDKTIGEKLDKAYDTLIEKYGKDKGGKLYQQVFDSVIRGNAMPADTWKQLNEATFKEWGFDNSPVGFSIRSVSSLMSDVTSTTQASSKALDEFKEKYQITEEEVSKLLSGSNTSENKSVDNKTLKQLLLDIDASKSKIKELQEQANKGLISSDKIKEEQDVLSKLTSDYKNRTGLEYGSTNQESAADKLRKQQESIREQQDKNAQLEKKHSLDRQRQQQDLEHQAAQAEIDALDDSFEKKEKQRALNNKKEIQSLERQKEDYINAVIQFEKEKFDAQEELNAKNIKGYNKKTFDSSTVKVDSSAFNGIINNTSKKQLNDKVREQEDSWNEYLIKFGDYQQKRKAIIEKYDKLIKEAEDAGKAATHEKDKQNAVDDLDNSIKNSSTLMGQLFADASQKSVSEIQKVIEKAELLMQYLESVKDEKGNAQIGGKTVSKKDILGLGVSDNTLQNLGVSTEEVEALRNAISKLKGELGGKSPFILFKSQIDAAIGKISQGGNKNIAQGITEIGGAIASFSPAISQFGQDLGNIFGSDDLGNKIAGVSDALGGVGQTAAGVGQIMSGDIVGGVMSAVSGISSVVSALDGLFGADYSHYNEMKEQYETISTIWDELIDKKTEYLEISTTEERKRAEQEILDIINKKEQAARNLGLERLNAGASAGSSSIGVRIRKGMSDEGWSQWDNFANSIGMNPDDIGGRLEGLFSLTNKQLEDLKGNAPDFWAKLDDDVRTYLEDIIKCGEQTEETTKKTEELWAGMSFDSMVDKFRDALSDMDSSTADFADDFQQYMINAMIDSFVNGEVFQKKLNDWHKKLAEYSQSDKEITKEEKDELQKDWDIIVKEGTDYRDSLFESMGFSNSKSTSQNSTKGMSQSMSQDTGDELNGRFTAFQISNEEIKNAMLSMLISVNLISVSVSNNSITLIEIRNIMISSNSYLEDIAKYTKELIGLKQAIANIESSAKSMAGK